MRTKNPRLNSFDPIVCGVLRYDEDSTPHTNRFSTRVPTVNTGISHNLSRLENKQDFIFFILEQRTCKGNNI